MGGKLPSFRDSLVYIICIIGNKGTEGRRGERLRKITGFLHCSLIGALRKTHFIILYLNLVYNNTCEEFL